MKHEIFHPVEKPFFTFGTMTILIFMVIGFAFGLTRLLLGLGNVTNLDNHNPWGIWISFDVACGVALAAGGFTTAALVEIFGKKHYYSLLRPAILTAFLGYLWVAIALSFDLGRYWNIWRPIFNWQGNSVLFEVGMCVTFYLMVLTAEMSLPVFEGLKRRISENSSGAWFLRKLEGPIYTLHSWVKIILPILIVTGVVLSFMHQSSLGTLMLIAPTKTSPLWNTTILPILFLLSAIMVGFPMVILESIYANISFGRKAEMELLSPLAAKIPILIAVYGTVKIADLVFRWGQLDFLVHPAATISLVIELLMGIFVPFILLSIPAVRRSVGWLFFSITLVIFGVILNRINVFLVSYTPPYTTKFYFPSVGEIALTIAIVCSILFCYRVFVTFFPVLPGFRSPQEEVHVQSREKTVSFFWTWVFRGTALGFVLIFVLLYTTVHRQAIAESFKAYRDVQIVRSRKPAVEPRIASSHALRPEGYKNVYLLNSPLLNESTDYYEPVRFSHRTHDVYTDGDCRVCHHRQGMTDEDRIGEDIAQMHLGIDVRIGGACSSCHDMTEKRPQSCRRCHAAANEADYPGRIGLKGAYHRQCIGCHQRLPLEANAPTDCISCHHPQTPDHSSLVRIAAAGDPRSVTAECIRCHETSARDILKTAHWNWRGTTPDVAGHEHSNDLGFINNVDNYFLSVGANMKEFSDIHIGYGSIDDRYPFSDAASIDCLVCHDTTGEYRREKGSSGKPDARVPWPRVAAAVGRPSRANCGSCHFYTGGAPNAKHGDLEPFLAKPTPEQDVHMGMLDMRCQDCHRTEKHAIAGLAFAAPVLEGRVTCEQCHGTRPHGIAGPLSRHLDGHVKTVACVTCHIPVIAREYPTRLTTDFSQAGQDRPPVRDAAGMPAYDKAWGTMTWGKNIPPVYRWFQGERESKIVGDKVSSGQTLGLNTPIGERQNPKARIYPFKVHTADIPYDSEENALVAPLLWEGFLKDYDWTSAVGKGMKSLGRSFSGKVGFTKTEMYSGIHHGVLPAKRSLGCADCHQAETVSCRRCHKDTGNLDPRSYAKMMYPQVKSRMDFKALGYKDDPALTGGRFYLSIGKGLPPR